MEGPIDYQEFPILLFDEKCPLCVRFIQSLKRIDPEESINSISLYDSKVYEVFPFLSQDKCSESIHLILSHEKFLVGVEAIEYLVKVFPQVQKFSWLMESKMGQKAMSYFYDMTNRYRESLRKRCPSCKTVNTRMSKR